MGDRGDIASRGSVRRLLVRLLVLGAISALAGGSRAFAQDSLPDCAPAVARLVSLQGQVEVQRAASTSWIAVRRLGAELCAGDRLRTDALSRAALYLQPETVVRLDQNTAIRFNQSTDEIEVEFFAAELAAELRDTQPRGAGYFITRFPKKFKVKTPHMNAAVEGTEFLVELSGDATRLTVLEGKVSSESTATRERQLVAAGQSIQSGAAGAGVIAAVVKPQDAVQWVIRYPPISDGQGATGVADAAACAAGPESAQSACLAARAEVLLSAGAVDDALDSIDAAIKRDPGNSDAQALRAVIQVAKNDEAAALASAGNATAAGAGNYRAWIAQSYAQQASFDLEAALASARTGQQLRPASALAQARVAELYLSLGDLGRAEEAARSAIAANPAQSHGHSILGFVHLAKIDTASALADFDAAIERDSFSAMPRLGRGLALIRDGDLDSGREQLEIAVALDPTNSLLRSYMGKAYYEENSGPRDLLAATQFGQARSLDPNDPTPAFYESILRMSQNQPVAALGDLQESIAKNDNRAVYRSRLQLDDDVAARTANLSGLFGELGFQKLAALKAATAIDEYPGNHSAHRLLASAYADQPRHDIARVSEVLQSQIRQPVSNASASPLLSVDNLGILRGTGPSQLGLNEFNELFVSDGLRMDFDGVAGERGTWGDQFQLRALHGSWSAAIGQLHYETDGFVDNDAAEKDLYDVQVQKQLRWNSSIQLDVKRTEFSIDDNFFSFDPDLELPVTISETSDAYRLSGHHLTSAGSDWIWTAAYEDRYRLVESIPFDFSITDTDAVTYAAEIQHTKDWGAARTVAGVGYADEDDDFLIEQTGGRSRAANAYVYGHWESPDGKFRAIAGIAADWYRRSNVGSAPGISRERASPKLALTWMPRATSTLRLAAFSAMRRPMIASQTVEPTQLAGFNQYFSGFEQLYGDREATISDRIALAYDQAMPGGFFGGVEISRRDLSVPALDLDRDVSWDESAGRGYLYKTVSSLGRSGLPARLSAVATLDVEYESIERPQLLPGSEGILELDTTRVPVGFRVFDDRGVSFRIGATYVRQDGRFSVGDGSPVFERDDEAWILDAAVDFKLPRRHGLVTVGVLNAGDDFIDLVEADVFNPRFASRRMAYFKVRISY
jgi:Tfp pilus assembly protein PilF